ncbi:MAG: preprotein translocase subunit SecA [Rhodothermales bacterium]|nr:preprotein translocase subunit SecA [Rhodothermales bacterium]
MIKFIQKLFGGDSNERDLKKLWPTVGEINDWYAKCKTLSDDELKAKTGEFKARIHEAVADIEARRDEIRHELRTGLSEQAASGDGQPSELSIEESGRLSEELDAIDQQWLDTVEDVLEELLPEAFAVVKSACERLVGQSWKAGGSIVNWDIVPYDVQLIGGIALHQGRVAEMKTGEGKTLVAVAPVYLNALAGRGVHLVTVNPYLAQRDEEWMGPIFHFLGLTTAVIDRHEPHTEARRAAYRVDITYGTNNEYGFDYLRDHSFVTEADHLVQREHFFAIVDEVDSVLIDEARTPLIISGPVPQANDSRFDELKPPVDQLVKAQQKLVAGFVAEAEKMLKMRDEARAAGENKKANEYEDTAGLALLRAHRGFRKNNRLVKLINEPGVEQLRQKTEFFYLQENAKNMPFVDEELFYALDEKQHAIEMTEKGRVYTAKASNQDVNLFVLPDIGEETALMEKAHADAVKALEESIRKMDDLTPEKRQHKLENDLRLLGSELAEKKRTLYTTYSDRAERLHAIEQLLKAYTLFEKDINYIVQEDKVMIVDEHTGRVLSGRRYSDGLHQAIEAKENVKVQAATQTYATITLQNYFRMYHKLSGMTGTAVTEAEEFFKIYKIDVVVIPTNKPVTRKDLDDLVFKTRREKFNAVIEKITEYNQKGQPVLVGTTTVEVSETLSRMLTRSKIKHNVLNARRDRALQEALIVAEAGERGAVTIATNMAGRGTDIKLAAGVRELGGLAIIGTERHESRRIDLQLRGRAGRQGDPGESQFYISLEDNLMSLFKSDRVARVMDRLNLEEGAVITHPWVNKSIERAQKKVEQNNFGIRKRQLEYDDVLNAQRQVVYTRRINAIHGDFMRGDIMEMLEKLVRDIVPARYAEGDLAGLREELLRVLALDFDIDQETFARLGEDGVTDKVMAAATEYYTRKREALARPFADSMTRLLESDAEQKPERIFVDFTDGRRLMRVTVRVTDAAESQGHAINNALERVALLVFIDEHWTEHLRGLDEVKEGIGLRAYGQRDPLVEYKIEAFRLFGEMMNTINQDVVSFVFRAGPLVNNAAAPRRTARPAQQRLDPKRAQASQPTDSPSYGVGGKEPSAADRDPTAGPQSVVVGEKTGRNDPCPCGSGKKYKHCHGK